jgi:hypothetical protein
MNASEYGRMLARREDPITDAQAEAAARILIAAEREQGAAA